MEEPNHARVILLAEDEPVVRNVIHLALTSAGYFVLTACDGEEALALSRAFDGAIDLLLTDVKMPRLRGPDLAQTLCRERPDIRVLLMTGKSSGEIPNHMRPEMLRKPFVPRLLLEKIQAKLSHPDGPHALNP